MVTEIFVKVPSDMSDGEEGKKIGVLFKEPHPRCLSLSSPPLFYVSFYLKFFCLSLSEGTDTLYTPFKFLLMLGRRVLHWGLGSVGFFRSTLLY